MDGITATGFSLDSFCTNVSNLGNKKLKKKKLAFQLIQIASIPRFGKQLGPTSHLKNAARLLRKASHAGT